MTDIAGQVFSHYQATRFPVGLSLGPRTVTLVSPAGRSVAKAGTSAQAEAACKALGARLPTAEEYSLLHVRGDWNGGVCTDGKYWALANGYVLAPALVRPSPSRREADVSAEELHFYCIRNPDGRCTLTSAENRSQNNHATSKPNPQTATARHFRH